MKNISTLLLFVVLISSCTTTTTLYSWGSKKKYDYHTNSYNYLKVSDDESIDSIKKSYIDIIERQDGTRKTVPPGIYADYGFLLLSTGEKEKGTELLKMEKNLYPESTIFIDRVLKMLNR